MTARHSLDVESACVGGRIGSTPLLHEEVGSATRLWRRPRRNPHARENTIHPLQVPKRTKLDCGPV